MHLRAYAYIRTNGDDGLRQVTDDAVLAANYLRVRLQGTYDLPYDRICKHEVVFSARHLRHEHGVSALDVAKAILDDGMHPPTIYFPLIVEEALMIEPTETETLDTLDEFVTFMQDIAARAISDPDGLREAPRTTPVGRLDEATAARQPDLAWSFPDADRTSAEASA
jgi:glycine dehydrogenase subunit 2